MAISCRLFKLSLLKSSGIWSLCWGHPGFLSSSYSHWLPLFLGQPACWSCIFESCWDEMDMAFEFMSNPAFFPEQCCLFRHLKHLAELYSVSFETARLLFRDFLFHFLCPPVFVPLMKRKKKKAFFEHCFAYWLQPKWAINLRDIWVLTKYMLYFKVNHASVFCGRARRRNQCVFLCVCWAESA